MPSHFRTAATAAAVAYLVSGPAHVGAQMQFEIPPEMLQGLMGGMMGGGGGRQQQQMTEWPKSENPDIDRNFEWLTNTEWKGKTAKYLLLKDGIIESPLKECEEEGMCLWAANNDRILFNTPTLKVMKFTVEGLDKVDRKKIENKDEAELAKLRLVAEKPGKNGKKSSLDFSRVAVAEGSENTIIKDLYKILDVAEDTEQGQIKSKFRRLSVQNHPDKGGDPKVFAELREAYEVLGDTDNRRYYDLGGLQLVKNVEMAWKEVEGQRAQMDAQLQQVPKNHPQYQHMKAQIDAQKSQLEGSGVKSNIEKKLRSEDIEVFVPVSAEELYHGVAKKEQYFQRLVMCRGCRADPDSAECKLCGRCPPEKLQVPKYGMTPFGKQVIGMREKEQENREKCREVNITIPDLRIPRGAKHDSVLKYVNDMGHQVPGKFPGRVVLKVERGSPQDVYTIAEADLYTVLRVSLEEALFGFTRTFSHLGKDQIKIDKPDGVTSANEVVKIPNKGLAGDAGHRGDLFVRLAVEWPKVAKGSKSLSLSAPAAAPSTTLEKEDRVEVQDGLVWKRWVEREEAGGEGAPKAGKKAKTEL